jgi:hypothetical protein
MIDPHELEAIRAAYPRLALKMEFKELLCQIVRQKPQTSYDSILRDIGEKYIPGYAAPSFADFLLNAPFAE